MRSDDVFAAAKKIGNRFLLCRIAAVSARRLQKGPRQFTESINKSFKLIASISAPQDKKSAAGSFDPVCVNSAREVLRLLGPEQAVSPLVEKLTAR